MADKADFLFFEDIIKQQFEGVYQNRYNQLREWSSMQSLIVVNTIDEHYDVLINQKDLNGAESLAELHALVIQKMT